jgi:hypothetical protein
MELDPTVRARLIEAARALAAERGWVWCQPVEVTPTSHRGEAAWLIRTNAMAIGRNVRVVIRHSDQAILDAGYLPR